MFLFARSFCPLEKKKTSTNKINEEKYKKWRIANKNRSNGNDTMTKKKKKSTDFDKLMMQIRKQITFQQYREY